MLKIVHKILILTNMFIISSSIHADIHSVSITSARRSVFAPNRQLWPLCYIFSAIIQLIQLGSVEVFFFPLGLLLFQMRYVRRSHAPRRRCASSTYKDFLFVNVRQKNSAGSMLVWEAELRK